VKRTRTHLGWVVFWLIFFWPIALFILWKNEQIDRENRE
jgi:hypothetical protein